MSTSASLRLASRRPASTPFVASPRLAAAMWTQPTSKLRTTSFPTQRTTAGDNTMLDELDSVRPPALPATETVLLECRPLRRGRPGARSALFSSLRHLRPFGEPARCCRRIRRRLQPSLPHCLLPPASSLPTAGFGRCGHHPPLAAAALRLGLCPGLPAGAAVRFEQQVRHRPGAARPVQRPAQGRHQVDAG